MNSRGAEPHRLSRPAPYRTRLPQQNRGSGWPGTFLSLCLGPRSGRTASQHRRSQRRPARHGPGPIVRLRVPGPGDRRREGQVRGWGSGTRLNTSVETSLASRADPAAVYSPALFTGTAPTDCSSLPSSPAPWICPRRHEDRHGCGHEPGLSGRSRLARHEGPGQRDQLALPGHERHGLPGAE